MGEKPSEWVEKLPSVKNFNYLGGENLVFNILRSSFDMLGPSEQSLFIDLVVYRPFQLYGSDFLFGFGFSTIWSFRTC